MCGEVEEEGEENRINLILADVQTYLHALSHQFCQHTFQ